MKSSLRTRLILSFVVIIIATMGSFALIGRTSINQWFNRMVLEMGQDYAQRVSMVFGWYYIENGGWEGVEDLVINFRSPGEEHLFKFSDKNNDVNVNKDEPPMLIPPNFGRSVFTPRDDRLLLLDANREIVFDSNPDAGSTDKLLSNKDAGVGIYVEEVLVGTVVVASSVGVLNTFQMTYLNNVNLYVLFGGIAAIVVAIVWGTWLAVRILRPVRALSEASLKLAGGDYSQRIPETSSDELGEMSRAFNQMADELERQEMLRRRTLADVAHELRTPLTVLQIDLESIEDGIIEPDAEAIDHLQLEVATLRNLVEDLRVLSLADAGELTLDFQPTDINGLIEINTRRIERSAIEKEIQREVSLSKDKLMVMGDEQRLSQVLLNLLSNAVQYTPRGGTIRVVAARAGNNARVSVVDTGEGISAQDLPHIFERLYRSDRARARQNGGSGLGLAIARSVVDAHEGLIWVESVQGQGSTFSFELPLIEDE